MDFLEQYFNDHEHPRQSLIKLFSPSDLWTHVPDDLLNSLVKSVSLIKAYVFVTPDDENVCYEILTRDSSDSDVWRWKMYETKAEVFEIITNPGRTKYLNLENFDDNVVVLGASWDEEGNRLFYYFSYNSDLDAQNCHAGKFETAESVKRVVDNFVHFCEQKAGNENTILKQIPCHIFNDCIVFSGGE